MIDFRSEKRYAQTTSLRFHFRKNPEFILAFTFKYICDFMMDLESWGTTHSWEIHWRSTSKAPCFMTVRLSDHHHYLSSVRDSCLGKWSRYPGDLSTQQIPGKWKKPLTKWRFRGWLRACTRDRTIGWQALDQLENLQNYAAISVTYDISENGRSIICSPSSYGGSPAILML
jgi:hypothetical protein